MKKLLFMMFLLGGVAVGFSSCGDAAEGGEETTDAVEEVEEEGGGH
ncbi:MAG: hypothetical protein ACI857_001768 [Arenicella sp.]|jgi:hypothetical protein